MDSTMPVPEDEANPRMCIVSRQVLGANELIRFVAGPDGSVVPDLKRRLPGRGAHVEAKRDVVELAVKRKLFVRSLRADVRAAPTLPDEVEALLQRSVLGFLGLARKAGQLTTGASRVDAAVRDGTAIAVLHAREAAADGVRKIDAARRARAFAGNCGAIPTFRPAGAAEMGLAFGGDNVIHAAVLAGEAGSALLKRLRVLASYRGESPANRTDEGPVSRAENESEIPVGDHAGNDGCGIDPA